MLSVFSRFHCAALAGWLLLGAVASEAQVPVKQVLILQSFDRGNLTLDSFTADFRVELDQRAGTPVNVVDVVVGPTGFVAAPEREVVGYIQAIFANRPKPDPAPVCDPFTPLSDLLFELWLGRAGRGLCGPAGARRSACHGECTSIRSAERLLRLWGGRRNDDVHRRPAASCGIAARACGRNTGSRCSGRWVR
jgi:hypothetical protein